MKDFSKAKPLILESKRVMLIAHVNPDGDAIGSCLALGRFLEKLGKTVAYRCASAIDGSAAKIPGASALFTSDNNSDGYDLIISVDSSEIGRIGDMASAVYKRNSLAIDHHESQKYYTNVTVCYPKCAACAELLYELLCDIDTTLIDKFIAENLFIGLATDTGGFHFNNVTQATMQTAAALLAYGVDGYQIIYDMCTSQKLSVFRMHNEAVNGAQFFENNSIAIMTFSKDLFMRHGLNMSYTEGAINRLIDVDCVRVAFAVTEVSKYCHKVSIRTKRPLNAATIGATFGGGGHASAAGCQLNGSIFDVYDKLVFAAVRELKNY